MFGSSLDGQSPNGPHRNRLLCIRPTFPREYHAGLWRAQTSIPSPLRHKARVVSLKSQHGQLGAFSCSATSPEKKCWLAIKICGENIPRCWRTRIRFWSSPMDLRGGPKDTLPGWLKTRGKKPKIYVNGSSPPAPHALRSEIRSSCGPTARSRARKCWRINPQIEHQIKRVSSVRFAEFTSRLRRPRRYERCLPSPSRESE
jgi:hypothetical protein